jgi:hypothetical protein
MSEQHIIIHTKQSFDEVAGSFNSAFALSAHQFILKWLIVEIIFLPDSLAQFLGLFCS